MKRMLALCAFTTLTLGPVGSGLAAPSQHRGYMLRDTTSLPPPAAGKARLVVARDLRLTSDQKPEFLFLDRTPLGYLAQQSAVAAEVEPGWHRVWLGRGAGAQVWMEFEPDGRYLLRLRETLAPGTWHADLVRESRDGYAEFALAKGMRLSVMDERGRGALERDLGKAPKASAREDSTARARAVASATLPIEIAEAWHLPLPSDAPATEYERNVGALRLDEKSLRFSRAGATVLEIPREAITEVRYGSQRGGTQNPWIKVGYVQDGTPLGVTFADARTESSTENYNRLFAELEKGIRRR